jgi:hypothetical protein
MGPMLLARVAVLLAAAAMLLLAGSGPLYQLGFLSLDAAFGGLRAAVVTGGAALAASIATIVAARRAGSVPHLIIGIACAAAGVGAVSAPLRARSNALAAAPLHDVTTDLQNPPEFTVLRDLYDERPQVLIRAPSIDALQRRAYPDVQPITLPVTSDMAFEEVLETMNELDWPVADASEDEGRVEATVRSPWFGFRDDIIIRLTPLGSITRVDVRAVSRSGPCVTGRTTWGGTRST